MGTFWRRLKQRKLVQWALAYIAAAFAFVQVLDVVVQRFGWPDRIEKIIILALAIGFFVALVLAWYHGERGVQRIGGTELLIIALLLAIGGGALWAYARMPARAPVAVARTQASRTASTPKPPGLPTASAATIPEKSVAVLPFANESGKQDEQFFSDGLSDDLITALSQFAGLKVISRNSAFQFRDSKDSSAKIGKLLGVAHLLEGSVQRAGDEVRITATLVNASDGSIVWSQRYDKPYKDLFALQDAITHSVAVALKAKLLTTNGAVVQSDRPPGGSLTAYTAFLRGIALAAKGTQADGHKAIAMFATAIKLDPHYARAYAEQAGVWNWLGAYFLGGAAQSRAYDEARRAVDKALQLDPDLAAGYVARSYLEEYGAFDWNSALADAQRAVRLAPDSSDARFQLALVVGAMGHLDRAAGLTSAALVNDPREAGAYYNISWYYAGLGRLKDAENAIRTAIAVQPQAAGNHQQLAIIEILRGDDNAALVAARQEGDPGWRAIALALAMQVGPDRKVADAALAKTIQDQANVAAYQIAEIYALRRDPDNMFKWLDRAWHNRDAGLGYLLSDPLILRYRNDPRFAAFAKKVGLPTATDAVAMMK